MIIPSDYTEGYATARVVEPAIASNYVSHTTIGDPEADEMLEELSSSIPQRQVWEFIQAGMERRYENGLLNAPLLLREFFERLESPPDWVDPSAFTPGIRMFHRNSKLVLGAMLGGVLIEGFSTNISRSFFITGRLRDQGIRRLKQNNRQMIESFLPGGLDRDGDGWKLSVRLRLVHGQIRRLLKESDEWDTDAWGTPLSAAHMGFAITAFSARLLKHMRNLGATFDDQERESFMSIWRYIGYLMGIPETILFKDEEEALKLFEIGGMCEPTPGMESIVMANSLLNSAPLVLGLTEPEDRRDLAKYVLRVSRALIGNSLADELNFPQSSTFGVLMWFRMQERYGRVIRNRSPKRSRNSNFDSFTSLMDVALFDEDGINYRLPDHIYAERSNRW